MIERSFKYFTLLSSNLLDFTMSKDRVFSREERRQELLRAEDKEIIRKQTKAGSDKPTSSRFTQTHLPA